jgi:D-alanyl-lipoteichoic acid acyltransferase DltB (MBOAT superfamily)
MYRRRIPVEKSLLRFAVFVSFFPQLVAGPIVRASEFLPQLRNGPKISKQRFDEGLTLIFRGLFKKIVIADLLAGLGVDAVFANPAAFSSWDLLFALYGYSFQIYNDFSGYSDIAIGAAGMLGFTIPQNFNKPYLSQNMREFWTRWHITLSSWLRDYLYISLGGNRAGWLRVRVNLMLTMLLGGLWHGAAMNFVLWGAYHGVLLVLAGRRAERFPVHTGFNRLLRQLGCFHLVVFGWLLFRVTSMENFIEYLEGLLAASGGTRLHPAYYAILGLGVVTHLLSWERAAGLRQRFQAQPVPVQAGFYAILLLAFCGATLGAPSFIYFQF